MEGSTDYSEAFSIGLTVLSAANLADYEPIYDLKTHEISIPAFNEALSIWACNNGYSIVLRGTILVLLKFVMEERLCCSEANELM